MSSTDSVVIATAARQHLQDRRIEIQRYTARLRETRRSESTVLHWAGIAPGSTVVVAAPKLGVNGTTFSGRVLAMTYHERDGTLDLEIEAVPPTTVAMLTRIKNRPISLPSIPIETDWIHILLAARAAEAASA